MVGDPEPARFSPSTNGVNSVAVICADPQAASSKLMPGTIVTEVQFGWDDVNVKAFKLASMEPPQPVPETAIWYCACRVKILPIRELVAGKMFVAALGVHELAARAVEHGKQ